MSIEHRSDEHSDPYLRNAWYVAAWAHEVNSNRLTGVHILGEPIVLWRNAAGELAAFEDRCVHRLAPLSLGRCEGERLRCTYHGLLYDRTGCVVEIPGQEKISSRLRVRTYPVLERYNWIWIWMGNRSANRELLPPLLGMDNPGYVFGHGQLDYAAEARLINDNLLNLGHASFLHTETFRVSETWAREHPKVTEHERSVRSERWLTNQGKSCMDDKERVDIYFCQEFFAPNALLMIDRRFPLGTAEVLKGNPPNSELADEAFVFSSQVVTPLTEKTARYFYIFGARPSENETAFDMTTPQKAFVEDKTMIEAQQRSIDGAPRRRFVANAGDRGVTLFNQLVKKLAREEAAQSTQSQK